jgi:hypothetical protein
MSEHPQWSTATRFEAQGSLARPGPMGRIVRLGFGKAARCLGRRPPAIHSSGWRPCSRFTSHRTLSTSASR